MSQFISNDDLQKWEREVLEPTLISKPLRGDERQLGGLVLLSADADKIKEYVFESAKLPEIRGASMILDELNWGEKPVLEGNIAKNIAGLWQKYRLPIQACIYHNGGSLLALVPAALASNLHDEIEELYPRETGAATITCVWQSVTVTEVQTNFNDLMARQVLKLRREKDEKYLLPFFEALPPERRCESCGFRPASVAVTTPALRWLCQQCNKKVERSKLYEGKKEWTRRFLNELLSGSLDCYPENYLNGYRAEVLKKENDLVKGANDLNEIAKAARDGKSIGFIYADGNSIGRQIEKSRAISEYQRKSLLLQDVIRLAVFTGLARHLKIIKGVPREVSHRRKIQVDIHPFEIITIGGDDALLIVPGEQTLDIAITIGNTFEDELAKLPEFIDQHPTLSAGFVVADHHNPIYFLHALSEGLLKNAKKRARDLAEVEHTSEGTVDFLLLKSQTMLSTDLGDLRSNYPWTITTSAPRREKALLTGRPYTWSMAEQLKYTAQIVHRGLPLSQIQVLRQPLLKGRLSSTLNYLYQWARADQERKMLLRWVEKLWRIQQTVPPPWIPLARKGNYDRYWTIWEDLWEAKDLITPLDDQAWQLCKAEIGQQMESEVGYENRNWIKSHT